MSPYPFTLYVDRGGAAGWRNFRLPRASGLRAMGRSGWTMPGGLILRPGETVLAALRRLAAAGLCGLIVLGAASTLDPEPSAAQAQTVRALVIGIDAYAELPDLAGAVKRRPGHRRRPTRRRRDRSHGPGERKRKPRAHRRRMARPRCKVGARRHAGAELCRPWRAGAGAPARHRARRQGRSAAARRLPRTRAGHAGADSRRRAEPLVRRGGRTRPQGGLRRRRLPFRHADPCGRSAGAARRGAHGAIHDRPGRARPRPARGRGSSPGGGPAPCQLPGGRPGLRAGARDSAAGRRRRAAAARGAELHGGTGDRGPGRPRRRRRAAPGRTVALRARECPHGERLAPDAQPAAGRPRRRTGAAAGLRQAARRGDAGPGRYRAESYRAGRCDWPC